MDFCGVYMCVGVFCLLYECVSMWCSCACVVCLCCVVHVCAMYVCDVVLNVCLSVCVRGVGFLGCVCLV